MNVETSKDAESSFSSEDEGSTSTDISATSKSDNTTHKVSIDSSNELFVFGPCNWSLTELKESPTNVTVLIIHKQPSVCLTGIDTLIHLTKLWITECQWKSIDLIPPCSSLKELHLYSNDITNIPKLPHFKNLELLGLSENNISRIENLLFFSEMKKLYLANNNIRIIGKTLYNNTKLRELDIAGNPIRSLQDLRNLAENVCLESLYCTNFDEKFRCPVTLLCNYRCFLVRHMPQLHVLDSVPIQPAERTRVNGFFNRAVMYFNIQRHHHLSKHFARISLKHKEYRDVLAAMKQAQVLLTMKKLEVNEANKRLIKKLPGPQQEIEGLFVNSREWRNHLSQWMIENQFMRQDFADRLSLELQAMGNLIFRYDNSNTLMALCQNLINVFSCEYLRRLNLAISVQVLKAYRVLAKDFVKKEASDPVYVLLTKIFETTSELCDWINNEWLVSDEFDLTTCLASADAQWLSGHLGWDPTSNKMDRRIAVIVELPEGKTMATPIECTIPPSNSQQEQRKTPLSQEVDNHKFHKSLKMKSDNLPSLLVVEFYYLFDKLSRRDKNIKYKCEAFISDIFNNHEYQSVKVNNSLSQGERQLESIVKHLKHPEPWNALTSISLQGQYLDGNFNHNVPEFKLAKTLDLSYNDIANLESIARLFPNVEDIILSYNKISSMDTLGLISSLVKLNLSWNDIRSSSNCVQVLSKTTPNLEHIDLTYNPIVDFLNENHLTAFASLHLPALCTVNAVEITQTLQNATTVNFQVEIKGKGYINDSQIIPVSLSWPSDLSETQLYTSTECQQNSVMKHMWVSLRHKRVTKVINPPNDVIWADLTDNILSALEFLDQWPNLEYLSVSRNIIFSLGSAITRIQNIVKLDLSENYITSLFPLKNGTFNFLKYLNVSNNKLKSFEGLETCVSMQEFYATNNYITSLETLEKIKSCQQLKVIDLSGNKISLLKELINVVVFHFRKIEYINNQCVLESDHQEAMKLFGGILDHDYLLRCHKRAEFSHLKHLSITQCNIKEIHLPHDFLPVLETLNLERNELTSLFGASLLPSLVSLNLGFNNIQCFLEENLNTHVCFSKLKTLYLNNNQIESVHTMCRSSFLNLETLFLQGNQLRSLSGLKAKTNLKTLLVDRNKITSITFKDCTWLQNLEELYMEGNKVTELNFLRSLTNLRKLFVGHNKVEDHDQLRNLATLTKLRELTLLGNPFCRVFYHYRQTIAFVPSLEMLDGYSLDITAFC